MTLLSPYLLVWVRSHDVSGEAHVTP